MCTRYKRADKNLSQNPNSNKNQKPEGQTNQKEKALFEVKTKGVSGIWDWELSSVYNDKQSDRDWMIM